MKDKPNPGSEAAQKLGCTCAIVDNNYGKFAPYPPDGWWITEGCPLHDPMSHTVSKSPSKGKSQ